MTDLPSTIDKLEGEMKSQIRNHNLSQINDFIKDIEGLVALRATAEHQTPEIENIHNKIIKKSNEFYSFLFNCAEYEVEFQESTVLDLLERATKFREGTKAGLQYPRSQHTWITLWHCSSSF